MKHKILKMKPVYKDYIWGGRKLKSKYGKITDIDPVAESWELSCHKDGMSTIDGGEYDSMTLYEYIKNNPSCLGTNVTSGELPVLIKLIDAADNLSVQVHPNDEQAKLWEGQNGKTEMWYVVEAEDGAKITYGLKKKVSEDELKKSIECGDVEKLLNSVEAKKGDVFFVEAGTIHAIGKGNLIAEIQQNSNVTYRLYDYGRIGKDGKPRELHSDKGVKASNRDVISPRESIMLEDGVRLVAQCEYFSVREMVVCGERKIISDEKSYMAVLVCDGNVTLENCDNEIILESGSTAFVPADCGEIVIRGEGTIIICTTDYKQKQH